MHAAVGVAIRLSLAQKWLNSKVHMAVAATGVPVRLLLTDGVTTDCSKAAELIDDIEAESVIADKAYDDDKIVKNCENLGMKVLIPHRQNRIIQREYDKEAYKIRRLVENAFLFLKDGEVLQRDTLKMLLHSLLPSKSDASIFGRNKIS
jgi:transposase